MERRTFIAIAGGGGLGFLLPYALYQFLSEGIYAGRIGVKNYLAYGPECTGERSLA